MALHSAWACDPRRLRLRLRPRTLPHTRRPPRLGCTMGLRRVTCCGLWGATSVVLTSRGNGKWRRNLWPWRWRRWRGCWVGPILTCDGSSVAPTRCTDVYVCCGSGAAHYRQAMLTCGCCQAKVGHVLTMRQRSKVVDSLQRVATAICSHPAASDSAKEQVRVRVRDGCPPSTMCMLADPCDSWQSSHSSSASRAGALHAGIRGCAACVTSTSTSTNTTLRPLRVQHDGNA